MNERDRKLGIGRSISRRDFIGGVGVALSGSLLSCSWAKTEAPLDPDAAATAFGRSPQIDLVTKKWTS